MKLSCEDKLTIYNLKKQGMTWTKIGKLYDVNISNRLPAKLFSIKVL